MKQQLTIFWRILTRPRVLIFLLLGAGIIFLTFLTNNNALEIAISGLASIFIGLAVNNFTAEETHVKDELSSQKKLQHVLRVLEIAETKTQTLRNRTEANKSPDVSADIKELDQLLSLLKQLLLENGA